MTRLHDARNAGFEQALADLGVSADDFEKEANILLGAKNLWNAAKVTGGNIWGQTKLLARNSVTLDKGKRLDNTRQFWGGQHNQAMRAMNQHNRAMKSGTGPTLSNAEMMARSRQLGAAQGNKARLNSEISTYKAKTGPAPMVRNTGASSSSGRVAKTAPPPPAAQVSQPVGGSGGTGVADKAQGYWNGLSDKSKMWHVGGAAAVGGYAVPRVLGGGN